MSWEENEGWQEFERSIEESTQKIAELLGVEKYYFYAILGEHNEVIPTNSIIKFANFKTQFDRCRVGRDEVEGFLVSTVFLGINHGSYPLVEGGKSKPLWFETMVFRQINKPWTSKYGHTHTLSSEEYWQERYETWDEALEGHKRVCEMIRSGEIGE
jgi:hypothetical protein